MSKLTIRSLLAAPPTLAVLCGFMAYNEYRATLQKEAVVTAAVLIVGQLILGILLSAAAVVSVRESESRPSLSVVGAWLYVLFFTGLGAVLVILTVPSMS